MKLTFGPFGGCGEGRAGGYFCRFSFRILDEADPVDTPKELEKEAVVV